MFINKNYSNLKKVADENSSNYIHAKPFPSIVFDNNTHEPLQTTVASSVEHDGSMPVAIRTHILQAESLRHREVELDGPALPRTLQDVANVEIDFRTIECAIASIDRVVDALRVKCKL